MLSCFDNAKGGGGGGIDWDGIEAGVAAYPPTDEHLEIHPQFADGVSHAAVVRVITRGGWWKEAGARGCCGVGSGGQRQTTGLVAGWSRW